MKIKRFKGTVRRLKKEYYNYNLATLLLVDNTFNSDMLVFGISAKDENGQRIDPRYLRMKTDGTYVIISE